MKVLVCGSRSLANYDTMLAIHRRIEALPPKSEIIHGGAAGPDGFAMRSAYDLGHTARPFYPDWRRHGRAAGIVRNLEMLDENPDLVIAYWDGQSRGTAHTIKEAQRRGIPVEVISA